MDVKTTSSQVEGEGKKNRIPHNEYLLDNIIDENFQAMLFPLTLVPSLFLMSQFSIINNFITPENNALYYIKYFTGSIILVLSHFIRFRYCIGLFGDNTSDTIYFLSYFDLIFFSVISIMTYIVSYLQRSNVVELIIKLHYVLSYIKIDKSEFLTKHKKRNWLGIVLIISFFICHSALLCQSVDFLELLSNFVFNVPLLICDVQVIIVTCIIEIIKNELIAWNSIMEEYEKNCVRNGKKVKIVDFERDMYYAYVNLVAAFRLSNQVFRFWFSYYVLIAFSHVLLAFQLGIAMENIFSEERVFRTYMMNFTYGTWNLKSIILIVVLSITCESFYRSVKIAESISSQILGCGQTTGNSMRATCKNVLRLNRAALRKLSAFGAFELDAAFPLRLLAGLVVYTVVMLQFAFLS